MSAGAAANAVCTFEEASHTYRIRGVVVPSITQAMKLGGLSTDYSAVAPATLAYARQRGDYVHQACETYDRALADGVPAARITAWLAHERLDPYRGHVVAWTKFRREQPVTFTQSEYLIWTDEDGGVAGRLDRAGTWDGAPAVYEIKATYKVEWPTAYQLAAQVWMLLGADALETVRRQVVHLKPDGTYALPPPCTDARDLDDFRAALRVAWCKLRHGVKLP